jgi:hypothetical protein
VFLSIIAILSATALCGGIAGGLTLLVIVAAVMLVVVAGAGARRTAHRLHHELRAI